MMLCARSGCVQGRCNADPNSRSVTIMITDCCPECEADHLDIQALTFNKMAPMALGRIDIRYRRRVVLLWCHRLLYTTCISLGRQACMLGICSARVHAAVLGTAIKSMLCCWFWKAFLLGP